MSEKDGVSKNDVLTVLRACQVDVYAQDDGEEEMTVFAKGEVIDVRRMPEEFSRRLVNQLGRKFGIPVHFFWNPHILDKS